MKHLQGDTLWLGGRIVYAIRIGINNVSFEMYLCLGNLIKSRIVIVVAEDKKRDPVG